MHARALIKSFLVYKRAMAENMANQKGARSYPKATYDLATEEIVDTEYEVLDVESNFADAVCPRRSVDYLGPSDAPLNRGCWTASKARQAAATAGTAGAGAPDGASPATTATLSLAAAAGAGGASRAAPDNMLPADATAAAPSGDVAATAAPIPNTSCAR